MASTPIFRDESKNTIQFCSFLVLVIIKLNVMIIPVLQMFLLLILLVERPNH